MSDLINKLKTVSPETPDEEIVQGVTKIKQVKPQISDDEIVETTIETKPMDDSKRQALRSALIDKYGIGKRQEIVDQNTEESKGYNWKALGAGLGSAIAGRGAKGAYGVLEREEDQRKERLSEFDKGRAQAERDVTLDNKFTQMDRADEDFSQKQEQLQRMQDPTSEDSKLAQTLASKMLPAKDFSQMNASQINKLIPSISKIYEIEQRKIEAQRARQDKRITASLKKNVDNSELRTPLGIANTKQDAKDLKNAYEAKQSFDNKLQQMIELREKYGAEKYNREAVARGQQLSKDLLLSYKNMAKLGVLSKSDEDIVNAIIPANPLAFEASSLIGQDTILTRLKAFQKDSDLDFKTTVQTRIAEPIEPATETKTEVSEVERMTKDGRVAVYDANTRKFLRYK